MTHTDFFSAVRAKRLRAAVPAAAIAAVLALMIAQPTRYAAACAEGIALWANAVLPALLPFLILTALLTGLGAAQGSVKAFAPLARRLRLPPAAAYCFVLSALSGYPVGARVLSDLYARGAVSRGHAARTAVLCSTSGPMFVIGSVGGLMFRDPAAGAVLYAAHLAGTVLVCLLALPFTKKLPAQEALPVREKADGLLRESVQAAVVSVLCVGGFIVLFSVLIQALTDLRLLALPASLFEWLLAPFGAEAAAEGVAAGLLECTRGCAAVAASGAPLALPLCAFLITFGGASILAQQLAYLGQCGVKVRFFAAFKAAQGAAAFGICLLLCALLL